MAEDLGRLRVLAGRLGLRQDTWSHLPEEQERANLLEYGHSVLDELEKRRMSLEQYLEIVDRRHGVIDGSTVRLPSYR